MKGSLPESTGLLGSGFSPRRIEATIWWRQSAGIFRSACRARLRPEALASRLGWLFGAQVVLAAVAAIGLHLADFGRIPADVGQVATAIAAGLLLVHALARLGSVSADLLRDVDEQLLEVYEASPLSASAYVAGRTAFHLVEQGLGFAALLPSFAVAHALRAFELSDFIALTLALLVVSLVFCLLAIARVLRAHARRPRGSALPPNQRQGAGAVVAQSLFGLACVLACFSFYLEGLEGIAPFLVAFALTPAVPLLGAAFDGLSVELFGHPFGVWLAATLWLALLLPGCFERARLCWKPPVDSSGAGLRVGCALAVLAPALVLSGTLREGAVGVVVPLLGLAFICGLVVPAWAGGAELGDIGSRPGARSRGLLSAKRGTAGAWALVLHAHLLVLLALLAPGFVTQGDAFALALVVWAGTAPLALVVASAARWLARAKGGAVLVVLTGFLGSLLLAGLPQLLSLLDRVPLLGNLTLLAEGPSRLLAASSPVLILAEAAHDFVGSPFPGNLSELPPAWSLGLPDWGAGVLVQALIGLPLAFLLHRSAERAGR